MTREDPQIKVRLPEALKDQITAIAKQNNRSTNAEIVARLERTLNEDLAENVVAVPKFMAAFMARVEQLVEEHGIEYVFPEQDHEGKKRNVKKRPK